MICTCGHQKVSHVPIPYSCNVGACSYAYNCGCKSYASSNPDIILSPASTIAPTEYQRQLLLKVINTYIDLRKSHFYEVRNSLKREKISDELVVLRMWQEQLKVQDSAD